MIERDINAIFTCQIFSVNQISSRMKKEQCNGKRKTTPPRRCHQNLLLIFHLTLGEMLRRSGEVVEAARWSKKGVGEALAGTLAESLKRYRGQLGRDIR